jgi:pimeloyl-ACP methyl ester carboxylesterase
MFIFALLAAFLLGGGIWAYTPDASKPVLEARYNVAPTDYIDVDRVHLHYKDTGPKGAPVVVLLHGFGSSLQTWDDWSLRLSANYRVVRFDLPGFGLTGADPSGDYSDERSVRIIFDLLDRLGIASATLIGNSMGGKIAWKAASSHPTRVEGLVLISPDGYASPGFEYGKRPSVPLLMYALPYAMPKSLLRNSILPAYADPAHLSDATVTRYWDMMRAPDVREAIIDRLRQTMLEDPRPALQDIAVPVLLIWGEKDAMIPFSNAQDYLHTLKSAELVSFPDLGHVPQEEDPDRALKPVLAYLAARRVGGAQVLVSPSPAVSPGAGTRP